MGRCSAYGINAGNRISLPYIVSAGLYFAYDVIPSEDNRGDDGTRETQLRGVSEILPHIRDALQNKVPLFGEELLIRFFQRGIPRGTASSRLIRHFENPLDLASYLQDAEARTCILASCSARGEKTRESVIESFSSRAAVPPSEMCRATFGNRYRQRCFSLGRRADRRPIILWVAGSKRDFPQFAKSSRRSDHHHPAQTSMAPAHLSLLLDWC